MKQNKKINHIAIVCDGNRRYAKKIGIPQLIGHEKGYNKITELLKWCVELKIKEITLYCFSTENFNRNKTEVKYLFNLFRNKIKEFKKNKTIHDNKVKVSFIGRLSMFPKDMQKSMYEIMDLTKNYNNYKLNLALAYGSRSEIVDTFQKLLNKGIKKVDENIISKNLYVPENVDIFIRPGGEKRLSNFLLWQSSYAELFFTEKLWPEFTKEDLIDIINEYKIRERRFGE